MVRGPAAGKKQGALSALRSFSNCMPQHRLGPNTTTYRSALNHLDLASGLVLESLRALYRDIPYMVSSALECSCIARTAKRTDPERDGNCTNVWLDDIMADYGSAVAKYFTSSLRLPPNASSQLGPLFASKCDPSAQGGTAHTTDRSTRARAIALLRKLDVSYLGGALAAAERMMRGLRAV
jgi:hypothetical protein